MRSRLILTPRTQTNTDLQMSQFLLYSIIASVVLTVLLNLLPRMFPGVRRRMDQAMRERIESVQKGDKPRVQVFFPWKWMLIISLVLTLLINVFLR